VNRRILQIDQFLAVSNPADETFTSIQANLAELVTTPSSASR